MLQVLSRNNMLYAVVIHLVLKSNGFHRELHN